MITDIHHLSQKSHLCERSSLPSENFPCISMDVLQIGAWVLLDKEGWVKRKAVQSFY